MLFCFFFIVGICHVILNIITVKQFSYCQILGLVLRLRVDFLLPLSQEEQQEEQEQQQEPPTKIFQKGCTRRLKFDA